MLCYNCLLISISILNILVEKVYLALIWYWCHIELMIADMWTCGPICCYKVAAGIKYINRVSVAVADSGQYPIRYYNPITSKPGTTFYRQCHRSTSSDGHSPNLTITGNVYSQQKLVWLYSWWLREINSSTANDIQLLQRVQWFKDILISKVLAMELLNFRAIYFDFIQLLDSMWPF